MRSIFTMAGLSLLCFGVAGPTVAQTLVPEGQIAQKVIVRDVVSTNDTVSGVLVNHSSRPVRDVKLLIRLIWHWGTERTPGHDSPGRAAYHTVLGEIAPAGSASFTYRIDPPLPYRTDGHFQTMIEVVGLAEVGG